MLNHRLGHEFKSWLAIIIGRVEHFVDVSPQRDLPHKMEGSAAATLDEPVRGTKVPEFRLTARMSTNYVPSGSGPRIGPDPATMLSCLGRHTRGEVASFANVHYCEVDQLVCRGQEYFRKEQHENNSGFREEGRE